MDIKVILLWDFFVSKLHCTFPISELNVLVTLSQPVFYHLHWSGSRCWAAVSPVIMVPDWPSHSSCLLWYSLPSGLPPLLSPKDHIKKDGMNKPGWCWQPPAGSPFGCHLRRAVQSALWQVPWVCDGTSIQIYRLLDLVLRVFYRKHPLPQPLPLPAVNNKPVCCGPRLYCCREWK